MVSKCLKSTIIKYFAQSSKMKLAIEQFSSILCYGFTALSSRDEDMFLKIREYKDGIYDEIFESVKLFGLMFSKEFAKTMDKIIMLDVADGFASDNPFMCFVLSRCLKLSETPTFCNFILACSFVHKIIIDKFRFLNTECFTLAKMCAKCLIATFYRQYVDLFEKENGFEELAKYCEKLNVSILFSSDEDSETEIERRNVYLEGFTPPKGDEIIGLIRSLNQVDAADILLTESEKNLFDDQDSLYSYIDPSEDIFVHLSDYPEMDKNEYLDLAVPKSNNDSEDEVDRVREFCPLCVDNCYKHAVLAAKELEVAELVL